MTKITTVKPFYFCEHKVLKKVLKALKFVFPNLKKTNTLLEKKIILI